MDTKVWVTQTFSILGVFSRLCSTSTRFYLIHKNERALIALTKYSYKTVMSHHNWIKNLCTLSPLSLRRLIADKAIYVGRSNRSSGGNQRALKVYKTKPRSKDISSESVQNSAGAAVGLPQWKRHHRRRRCCCCCMYTNCLFRAIFPHSRKAISDIEEIRKEEEEEDGRTDCSPSTVPPYKIFPLTAAAVVVVAVVAAAVLCLACCLGVVADVGSLSLIVAGSKLLKLMNRWRSFKKQQVQWARGIPLRLWPFTT